MPHLSVIIFKKLQVLFFLGLALKLASTKQ